VLVPDRVYVLWVGILEEPLEEVHRRPRLTLVTVHGHRVAPHIGTTHLPIVAVVMVGHGRGPLRVLLVPPFAFLDAFLSAVDGDIGRRLLAPA
jgi:hypothetical protein